ncbi:hypothetical protein P1X15_29780 [Runella sp. MFBS21]|uniref:hypothetical protein n=1 Tax=Runella sp. MFBS21 TaxID=3034018 RepID=UPI0023F8B5B7|nr:hypothetical protein [Runella sp. MFBS21]MDF7821843.1 hypothetical protein [Runella sp. MFBS21]
MKKYQISLGEKKIIKDEGLLKFEEIKKQIRILPELEQLIPPLLPNELEQLERNILQEGCREALLIWQTTEDVIEPSVADKPSECYILVDGHNRYNICTRHNIDFKIHLVAFKSLYDVRQFMIDNQLGRRNLTPEQASYLRGMKYLTEKKEKGKYERPLHKGQNVLYEEGISESLKKKEHKGQNVLYEESVSESLEKKEHKGQNVLYDNEATSTAERLGKQFNVSEKTIKRDAEFASGIEKLDPVLKSEILLGKTKVNKTIIQRIGKDESMVMPLTTVAEIEEIAAKPRTSSKEAAVSLPSTKKDVFITQLVALSKELQQTGAVNICDEIIICASEIKKMFSQES